MTVNEPKSGERGKIAEEGYTIIANVGDQESDLSGGYAEWTYKLPTRSITFLILSPRHRSDCGRCGER